MLVSIPTLDTVLLRYQPALGADFHRYRNHAYRVANLHWCLEAGSAEDLELIAIAVGFHDLGLWTANTFDYLAPSEQLATQFLTEAGKEELIPLIVAMIDHHHKLSPVGASFSKLVETFRRADWIDVSRGIRTFGLPRRQIKLINSQFPNLGFHRRLLQVGLHHAKHHPLNPLPMFKW